MVVPFSAVDFAGVNVGNPVDTIVLIKNEGLGTLTVVDQGLIGNDAAEFVIVQALPALLAPGTDAQLVLRCDPNTDGVKAATYTFKTNDPINPTVTLILLANVINHVHSDAQLSHASLDQNFPNPFGNTTIANGLGTTIQFTVPRPMEVTLMVCDPLGLVVKRVIDAGALDAGTHTVSFDALDLPSGVYFYRLVAGGTIHTRRMVLQR